MSIKTKVRQYIPATYDALLRASSYGPGLLDDVIDTVKYRLFATIVSATEEDAHYDPFVQDYVAKVATVRIIPGGCDYWADERTSETTREESISYPDRIASLWRIHERLVTEVRQDQDFFEAKHPAVLRRQARGTVARVSTVDELLTPDPQLFGAKYGNRRLKLPYAVPGPWG